MSWFESQEIRVLTNATLGSKAQRVTTFLSPSLNRLVKVGAFLNPNAEIRSLVSLSKLL